MRTIFPAFPMPPPDPQANAAMEELAAKPAPKAAPPPLPAKPVLTQTVVKDRIIEVPVLGKRGIRQLEKLVERMEKARSYLGVSTQALEISTRSVEAIIGRMDDHSTVDERRKSVGLPPLKKESKPQGPTGRPTGPKGRPGTSGIPPAAPSNGASSMEESGLLAGERRILEVLAQFHPGSRTRSQLGTLTGLTPSGGTFGNDFGRLRKKGYLKEQPSGDIVITEAGLGLFGGERPQGPQTAEEVVAMWRGKLIAGERKMLDVLLGRYPDAASREELGQATSYAHTGGTFGNYLGTLRRNQLVTVDGDMVRASETLFSMAL